MVLISSSPWIFVNSPCMCVFLSLGHNVRQRILNLQVTSRWGLCVSLCKHLAFWLFSPIFRCANNHFSRCFHRVLSIKVWRAECVNVKSTILRVSSLFRLGLARHQFSSRSFLFHFWNFSSIFCFGPRSCFFSRLPQSFRNLVLRTLRPSIFRLHLLFYLYLFKRRYCMGYWHDSVHYET